MRNIRLKTALFIIVGISTLFGWALIKIQEIQPLSFGTILKLIPKVVSADALLIALFSSFLWKMKIFQGWLVPFPNLNGTWKGHIRTTWTDPVTGTRPGPIPAILTIKQSFFKISCVMRTAEMSSRSTISDFVIDADNQVKHLFYTYSSNPIQAVKERSAPHYGSMAFDIIEDQKKILKGQYWTDRKTTGDIEMAFWKKKRLDYYPPEVGDHPVSSVRNDNA